MDVLYSRMLTTHIIFVLMQLLDFFIKRSI